MSDYHSTETELLGIVNTWAYDVPNRDKDFRTYRKWLAEEADKMPDDDWEDLTEETKEWLNMALIAIQNKHWPPNFVDPYEKTESVESGLVLRPTIKYKKNSALIRVRELFCEYGMDIDYDTAMMILAKEGLEMSYNSFAVQKSYFRSIVKVLERYGYLEPGIVPLIRLPEKSDKKKRISNDS